MHYSLSQEILKELKILNRYYFEFLNISLLFINIIMRAGSHPCIPNTFPCLHAVILADLPIILGEPPLKFQLMRPVFG
jgi:hypothetical protein